jgi:uncharacterized protein YjiS (DUF1127 family)
MEMAHSITNTYDASIAGGLGGLIERLRRGYANYRLYRKTLDELEVLNDRELNDLGISRLVIREIARESVYGK